MDRLKIYQDALVILKEIVPEDREMIGLCYVLSDAYCRDEYGKTYSELWDNKDESRDTDAYQLITNSVFGRSNLLPEIAAHRPYNANSGYWDITYGDRIKILEESIEQAKADYSAKEDWDMDHYDSDNSQNE